MSYKIERIASFVLVAPGHPMEISEIKRRSDAKFKEFRRNFPILKSLKASTVQLQSEATKEGHIQHICLQSNGQYLLPLAGGPSRSNGEIDAFLREVASVRKDMESTYRQSYLASSPGLDPASQPSIEDKRRFAKDYARGDFSLLQHIENFDLGQGLPMVQPRGQALEVTVQVKSLERSSAKVKVLEMQSVSSNSTGLYPLQGICVTLKRLGRHRSADSGHRLQYAMDNMQEVRLSVALAFDWQAGKPAFLELNEFI